jgi:short-subunit dehydrogenase
MKNFAQKTVVITGAASGIGAALAQAFATENARLILCDRDADNLQQVAAKLGAAVLKTFVLDVSKFSDFEVFAKEVEQDFGGADIMINNAGVALGKMTAQETSIEQFEWLMGVNFWGMVYGSKLFLPQLHTKKEGVLVNVSSLFGLIGIKYQSAYCSSKFAIRGFTESLIAENDNKNLQIHVVHPGGVNTQISLRAQGGQEAYNKIFHDKFLTKNSPEKAAKLILRGIKHNKQRIFIGSESIAGDLAARLLPIKLINFVQKHFHKDLD